MNNDGSYECDVFKSRSTANLFIQPVESKELNIHYVENPDKVSTRKVIKRKDLKVKGVCLKYKKGFVVSPLIHTLF